MPADPERFDRYQERCLYDPVSGFYERGGRAGGAGGDFLTSPELGPLFGEVLARALAAWWEVAGRPAAWLVAEAAAGRGALARSVIPALRALDVPVAYHCIERSARLREEATELLGPDVAVSGDLPERIDVLVANELVDNLPVRVVERTPEGWAEVWVPDQLRPTELDLDVEAPVGARLPVLTEANAWVTDARRRADRLVLVDYGVAATGELVGRQWLRTYRRHGIGIDPEAEPGSVDLTIDVPFDQLPAPDRLDTQAAFLRRWGIDELVEEGRRTWRERAAIGDLAAVRARSRVHEADALLDPTGLGGFLVAEWGTG